MPSTGIPAAAAAAARRPLAGPTLKSAVSTQMPWKGALNGLRAAPAETSRGLRASKGTSEQGLGALAGTISALCNSIASRWRVQGADRTTRQPAAHVLASSSRLGIGAGLFVIYPCTAPNSDQAASSPPQPPAARAGFVRRDAVATGAVHSGGAVDTLARHLGRSHKPGSGRCSLAAAARGLHAPWPSPPALSDPVQARTAPLQRWMATGTVAGRRLPVPEVDVLPPYASNVRFRGRLLCRTRHACFHSKAQFCRWIGDLLGCGRHTWCIPPASFCICCRYCSFRSPSGSACRRPRRRRCKAAARSVWPNSTKRCAGAGWVAVQWHVRLCGQPLSRPWAEGLVWRDVACSGSSAACPCLLCSTDTSCGADPRRAS